jgi:hypothetical protein
MVALGFQKTRGELDGARPPPRAKRTASQSMLDVIVDDGTVTPRQIAAF